MCRAGLIAGIDKSPHLPYQRAGGIAPSPVGRRFSRPRSAVPPQSSGGRAGEVLASNPDPLPRGSKPIRL
jgi:hypothetical protein